MNSLYSILLAKSLHLSVDDRLRPASLAVDDLDILEAIAAAPAGAHGLEEGFLGCEPDGELLRQAAAGFTRGDLPGSKDPLFQSLGPADPRGDATGFNYIRAQPKNQRETSLRFG